MTSGNFDPSLVKYKPQKQESISVTELFDQFVEHKKRTISQEGLAKYIGLQKHVSVFFGNKNVIAVTETVAESFRHYLAQKLERFDYAQRTAAHCARTDRDVRTLYENYAGLVNPPQLPVGTRHCRVL